MFVERLPGRTGAEGAHADEDAVRFPMIRSHPMRTPASMATLTGFSSPMMSSRYPSGLVQNSPCTAPTPRARVALGIELLFGVERDLELGAGGEQRHLRHRLAPAPSHRRRGRIGCRHHVRCEPRAASGASAPGCSASSALRAPAASTPPSRSHRPGGTRAGWEWPCSAARCSTGWWVGPSSPKADGIVGHDMDDPLLPSEPPGGSTGRQ